MWSTKKSLQTTTLNMLWTLWLLALSGNIGLTTPAEQQQSPCQFPTSWEGTWYHSGFPHPLNISLNHISSKGTCVQQSGSMFIMADRHNCQKCMVIHEKHPNVLQYKESYCHPSSTPHLSLESLCSSIESDSALFFMFRTTENQNMVKADTELCPFRNGDYAFSYSTRGGAKVCEAPASKLDTCTDEAKMVFQFQACPDVPGSERSDEILECVAMWKEGSSRYLVGRIMTSSQQVSNSKYQCFRYERHFDDQQGRGIVVKMAQSYSGACEGLWSAEEGDRTYTLWTVPTELRECGLPEWIVNRSQWTSLDTKLILRMTPGSSRRFELVVKQKTHKSSPPSRAEENYLGVSQMTCKTIMEGKNPQDKRVKIVAHQKQGCFSGFVCLEITFLHENVIHMRIGNRSSHEDEACRQHFFSGQEPLQYLLADEKSIECPFLGKYVDETSAFGGQVTSSGSSGATAVKGTCQNWIQSGCPLSTDMLVHLCSNQLRRRIRDVTCIGTWRLNGRTQSSSSTINKSMALEGMSKAKEGLAANSSSSAIMLALRDQKGNGECLEYRKTENSSVLQVSYFDECYDPNHTSRPVFSVNVSHRGGCQEALMDAHAVSHASLSIKYGCLLQFYSLISMLTVMLLVK